MMLRRRHLLATGLAAPLLGGAHAASAQATTLRVTHFGGPYQILSEIAGQPFEAAKGARVAYSVEISPSALTKLQTQKASPPFDVVLFSRAYGLRAMNGGLLHKVSRSDFPEAAHALPDTVPEAGWGAAMMIDSIDMMARRDLVGEPMTSWFDLWRPALRGKVMLPSAVNGATAFGFIACIVHALGDMKSPATANEAFARLKALKPAVRGFYVDPIQPNQMIERGDIAAAPQFAVRVANSARNTPEVVKVTPKEGVLAVPYDLCIPVNSPSIALAKSYIDFLLTKPVQGALAEKLLASPVRTDVTVPPALAPLVTTDPTRLFFQDEEFAAAKQREWLDRYTREVQN
ncbi:extracellular solute-binding protein [Roseomonas sp. NAR14]|uniref:Extracellular solute-binding protein n=1 Tax=Roseomonas acroporae TaxID=2937791 RepID=A0A9X1YJ18_9PROT|nr:extracellular solute-binding protein [Roseomonas acroporae]MCK8787066.1 extracellular solute-binding protein [Roseomonas acroporae]